jgi:hypothetical protein
MNPAFFVRAGLTASRQFHIGFFLGGLQGCRIGRIYPLRQDSGTAPPLPSAISQEIIFKKTPFQGVFAWQAVRGMTFAQQDHAGLRAFSLILPSQGNRFPKSLGLIKFRIFGSI